MGRLFGRPLNARDLAKLLKPYGVRSVDVKVDGVTRKGYRREHLHDPWTRYLPPAARGKRYLRYLRYRAGQRAG